MCRGALIRRGHHELVLENIALRQQLHALKRCAKRPQLRTVDRVFWILLTHAWGALAHGLGAGPV